MTLQPGFRFVVAPHFHVQADWSRRLRVGAGVEEVDDCFFPQTNWRPPTDDELSLLVRASTVLTPPEQLKSCVVLFQLPGHLRSEWWDLLEQSAGLLGNGLLPGFDVFVGHVSEFLAFKNLSFPEGARCDMVVSNPGQRLVHWGPENRQGLVCNVAPWAPWPFDEEQRWPRLWGAINLGDEETSVVLINLPCQDLDAELQRRFPGRLSPAKVGEMADRFLRYCSDYPPVRLVLGPGDGYRLPQGGIILDGYLGSSKQEPDVLLLISVENCLST